MIPAGAKKAAYAARTSGGGRKKLVLLGSTGSIGQSALAVVRQYPERYQVLALAAGGNVELLAGQIREFQPQMVSVRDDDARAKLKKLLPDNPAVEILCGEEGACSLAALPDANLVLCSIVGFAGLRSTVRALEAGNDVALANKESLVVAGALIQKLAGAGHQPAILPVDSEHSAIFQALQDSPPEQIQKIVLTASGGPFLHTPQADFKKITPAMALDHPRWKMGPKVTIDSATMFNKGLELIEAHWLFGMPAERIEVLVHPQSLVHSMVEAIDGSLMAQLGQTDMRGPIGYAFSWPERLPGLLPSLSLSEWRSLEFFAPDATRFPALTLAAAAAKEGGSAPCTMNAANEVAVEAFLQGRIGFERISELVDAVMQKQGVKPLSELQDVFAADEQARRLARDSIE